MKKLFEPFIGLLISLISWEAWKQFLISMALAFIGGAMAYLGKWIAAKIVQHLAHKKNVFISKTREEINSHNSPKTM